MPLSLERRASVDSIWDQTLDILIPNGIGLVAALEAYFDESERTAGVFSVAGYLFEPGAARAYAREATEVFGRYGGFHMKSLVHRRRGYEGIGERERDDLVKEAVRLVNHHMLAGATVSCWTQDVKDYSPDFIRGFNNAYSVCCHLVVSAMALWLKNRWPGGCGGVAYVFEAGHEHAAAANDLLSNAERSAFVKSAYQYRSHAFVPKADAPPLWSADLLAWEWTKFWDETVAHQKRQMRLSLATLLANGWDYERGTNPRYIIKHLGGPTFVRFFNRIRQLGVQQLQEEAKAQDVEAAKFELPETHNKG